MKRLVSWLWLGVSIIATVINQVVVFPILMVLGLAWAACDQKWEDGDPDRGFAGRWLLYMRHCAADSWRDSVIPAYKGILEWGRG